MRRVLGLMMALTLFTGVIASCGDDDNADGTTTTAAGDSSGSDSTSSDDSGSSGTSDTGNAKVDDFCNEASELAKSAQKAIDDKDADAAQQASKDAQDLAKQATGLTSEVISDPSLASKIQECTQELSKVGS